VLDIRDQILRRGKETIYPGIGEEGTGLMGPDVAGGRHTRRLQDIDRTIAIANMLIDDLRLEGKVDLADNLNRELGVYIKGERGEPLPTLSAADQLFNTQEWLDTVNAAQRKVSFYSGRVRYDLSDAGKAVFQRDIQFSFASSGWIDRKIQEYMKGTGSTYNEALNAISTLVYTASNVLWEYVKKNKGILPDKLASAKEGKVEIPLKGIKEGEPIGGIVSRGLTPAEKQMGRTLYTAVRDTTPYEALYGIKIRVNM
jgi:hypothetical protein